MKFLLGLTTGLGLALAANYAFPAQSMVQAVPNGENVYFEVKTHRATRNHSYVIPQFSVPENDGTDEGNCGAYSEHWFGLCTPS